jgi:carboxyl-terminal processing protease
MKKSNNSWKAIMPIFLALMLVVGMFIGQRLKFDKDDQQFFIYPQTNKLNVLLNYIEEEYVDSVSKEDLIEDAIPLILEDLDPHSVYIPAKELKATNENLHGAFDGIGVQFNIQNDTVVVIHTIIGGPSEKVGIMAGDRIVSVDDSLIAGISISNDNVMSLLKGERGSKVVVSILRNGEQDPVDFEIIRDKIPLYSVDVAYMIDDSIGYIKISRFSANTYKEFRQAAGQLLDQNMQKLIIDVRGNNGGYLEVCIKIVDEFLEANKMIVYTEGKSRPKTESLSTSDGICKQIETVVLIDAFSASASEILAGAFQDNDRGTIIGRRSFGKGLVQEQTQFPDNSALRLTIARYYTPTGRSIQKPYTNGHTEYFEDLHIRMANGEFSEEDSIQFPDSLKFITPAGKVVYGGGGIMPDIFVPIDTTGVSDYYAKVRNRGLIYQFAFRYTDKNRQLFTSFAGHKELVNHLKGEKLLEGLILFAEQKGIEKNMEDIQYSKDLLNTMIYAQIARNIFNDEGFYPVIKDIDATLLKGIEVLR